jgi:hypothetical protein
MYINTGYFERYYTKQLQEVRMMFLLVRELRMLFLVGDYSRPSPSRMLSLGTL